MDGIGVHIEGLEELNDAIARRTALLADPTPLLDRFGLYMLRSIRKNFREGGRPEKWAPSHNAETNGKKTLMPTGRNLLRSINYEVSGRRMRVGTNFVGARILHEGGTIVPKQAKALRFLIGERVVFAKSVTMPARPYLHIHPDDARRMLRMADEAVQKPTPSEWPDQGDPA